MASAPEALADADSRMRKSADALKRELNSIRTGRASPALVENIAIDYYGAPTPLNQLATISVPEARVLMIQPWDKQSLKDVERGIMQSGLGLVLNNDGNTIRINIPTLTEERRRDLVRLVGSKVEESNVAVRNIRRDIMVQFREMQKKKELSVDDARRAQEQLQRITDSNIDYMNIIRKDKEAEVMEV